MAAVTLNGCTSLSWKGALKGALILATIACVVGGVLYCLSNQNLKGIICFGSAVVSLILLKYLRSKQAVIARPTPTPYEAFSLAPERWEEYVTVTSPDAAWICCARNDQRYSDKHKVHISIHHADMATAFAVIFPLLQRYQVIGFKIMKAAYASEPADPSESNAMGKEIVVYVQPEEQALLKELLETIRDQLQAAGVQPGVPSTGDVPLKGSNGFFYARASCHVLGGYVPARYLNACGFTRYEGAHLSDSPCVDLALARGEERSLPARWPRGEASVELQTNTNPQDSFTRDLDALGEMMSHDASSGASWPLYKSYCCCFMQSLLKVVVKRVSAAREHLGCSDKPVGCIIPAFYVQVVKPLVQLMGDEVDGDAVTERYFSQHQEEIIKALVLCSFRTWGNQQEGLEPQYMIDPALLRD